MSNTTKKRYGQEQMGVLVIGCGGAAKGHLKAIHENTRLKLIAVADPNEDSLQWTKENYAPTLAVSNYKEALDRDDIDIVMVLAPHYLHHIMVLDSLRSGKHVLCEKPISISVWEADEMIDTAKECGKELFVMLNNRFSPSARVTRELLDSEQIGRIFMARSGYFGYEVERLADMSHWKGDLKKAGGGVLVDGGYHIVDLMNGFLGPARTVSAEGGQLVIEAEGKGEDNISLLIEYENGATATLQVSFTMILPGCDKEPTLAMEHSFLGTNGTIYSNYSWNPIEGLAQHLDVVSTQGRKSVALDSVEPLNQLDHFISCIVDGTSPLVSALDARNASAVVEAAYESIKTGTKVKVDWRKNKKGVHKLN